MDSIDPAITPLMAKYARREPLTPEELQQLEAWWEAAPENRELADLVRDEKWVEEALEIMDEAPEEEMWEEFSRRLDEKQGIVRPAPFWSFRMQWPTLWRGVAVAGLLFLAVRAIWLLTRKGDVGVVRRELVSAPRIPEPAPPHQPVLIQKDETPIRLAAHTRKRDTKAGDVRTDEARDPAKPDGQVQVKSNGQVPVKRLNRYDPAPVPPDTGGIFHYCKAVVPSSSPDMQEAASTVDYPYSYSTKALLTILSDREGPTEIHFNGKQMRVAGMRRFEKAGVDAAVKKGAAPVAPPAGFHFNDTRLEQALAQVAEWYGLKVSNPEGWKGVAITGELPRPSRPEGVLDILQLLEQGQVQLRLEQNTIVVSGLPGSRRGP